MHTAARHGLLGSVWVALVVAPGWTHAQTLTQEEALRLAFPAPAAVERETAFLTAEQTGDVGRISGQTDFEQRVVTYYVGTLHGTRLGAAYFDVHRVRTLPEVLMVVVTPDDTIERIEVLRFSEPPNYRAPEGWLASFRGWALTDGLSLKRDIVNVTGATLTARAVTDASRRVLALHSVIQPFGRPRSVER